MGNSGVSIVDFSFGRTGFSLENGGSVAESASDVLRWNGDNCDGWLDSLYAWSVESRFSIWSGRSGNSSVVEHRLAKARVAGSNPVSRSNFLKHLHLPPSLL